MTENPYAAPKADSAAELPPGMIDPQIAEELRAVGSYQRYIQICILVQVVCYITLLAALSSNRPGPGAPAADPALGIAGIGLAIGVFAGAVVGGIFAVLLALRVYNVFLAVIFGLTAFIPCIGLLGLFVINQRATTRLTEFDVPVGFMGADLQALEERIQQRMVGGIPPHRVGGG